MNKEVIKIITIFIGIPIILSSYNLSLTYKINKLKKEIKDIEIENNYKKKELYSISSPQKIIKDAELLGFKTPEPYTIVTITNKKDKTNTREKNLLAKIYSFKKQKNS